MTSDGSACARVQRALRSKNLPLIYATSAELGWVALRDALAILIVIDERDEDRFNAAAVRWVGRLALEVPQLKLEEFVGAIESLHALPDENAQRSLLALCERAVRPKGLKPPASADRRSHRSGPRRP
jgi:hypothetical protein